MTLREIFQAAMLGALLSGCGVSNDVVSPPAPTQQSDAQLIQQAILDDPDTALRIVPTGHLDAPIPNLPQGNAGTFSVADLEAKYETVFCSLSAPLNVTESTPQVVGDINFIKSQSATGNFDLLAQPILNNPLGVTGVSFQPVTYDTTVPLPAGNQTFHVSGGLLLPQGISKSQLKGVIVYFHATAFNKSQVGSDINDIELQLMAAVFGSQGYIVVIPDYVGQGVDWQNVHPYVLYPKASAQAAVDMLDAVRPTIATEYAIAGNDPALKLFSAGYSEGGSYSLWFNIYLSSNPALLDPFYLLTHSVGMEGAYNTSNVTFGYLFDDVSAVGLNPYHVQTQVLVNAAKPMLGGDALLAYAAYSAASNFSSVFNADFFAMKASPGIAQSKCNVNGQQVNIAQAFGLPDTNVALPVLLSGLGKFGNGALYPGPQDVVTSSRNSMNSLVSPQVLTPAGMAQLKLTLQAADADLTPVADAGVSIISLEKDSMVVSNNFDFLQSTYPTKIRNAIKIDQDKLLILSPFSSKLGKAYFIPTDHLHGLIYEFLYALHIYNSF